MSLLRCFMCKGRKKVYKIAGAYTLTDIGGSAAIECPECGGIGKILSEEEKEKLRVEEEEKNRVVSKKGANHDKKERRKG